MILRRGVLLAAVALGGSLSARARGEEPRPRPPAAIGGAVDFLHGYEVRDPFRGLEDREGADAWIRAHNAVTQAWWDAHPDPALDARLAELFALDRVWSPRVEGAFTFFLRQRGDREQAVLMVMGGAAGDGKERPLVDPNETSPKGRTAIDWYHPSEDGRLVAYGLSSNGTEDSVLHVVETESGKDLGLAIPDTRWCHVSWLPDGTGFYYTRYPPRERYLPRVRFHRMGDDPEKDPVVFGEGLDRTSFPGAVVSEDGTHIAFTVDKGWSSTDVLLEERGTGTRTPVVTGGDGEHTWVVRVAEGNVWALTNVSAPRFRLVRFAPETSAVAERTGVRFARTDVVPETEWKLEGAQYAAGSWILQYLDAAASRLVVVDAAGARREIPLPEPLVELGSVAADANATRFLFTYSSFATPSALVESDATSLASRVVVRVDAGGKADAVVVERVRYPSADGTLVPMRVVRPAGAAPGTPLPTLLTGYGGFNVSLGPGFDTRGLVWVERGGVFAEPNLRGGGELGETWHQAGARENKPRVFEDFEYAMRWLLDKGVCTRDTLAINGGSNGGLLVGAMMTRCPELFGTAVGEVGLYDMVRYQLWPPADIWSDEFGSAADPKQIGYLLGYSPYHQVRKGVPYPAFLGSTGEQDERVTWRHTAKFVAALEAATSSSKPLFFHMETKVGHGQGKPRSERIKERSRLLRFLWANAGGTTSQIPK